MDSFWNWHNWYVLWAIGFKYKGIPIESCFWLISSLLWIWFAIESKHNGLATRELLGLGLYIFGISKFLQKNKILTSNIDHNTTKNTICNICKNKK